MKKAPCLTAVQSNRQRADHNSHYNGVGMSIISYPLLFFKEEITMKQLTSYNRVAGYLNKLFDLLNQRFFENELSRPTYQEVSHEQENHRYNL